MPTALIADPDPAARDELTKRLGALWPELAIVGSADDGQMALALLAETRADVLLLDLALAAPSALDVAERVQRRCHLLFLVERDSAAATLLAESNVAHVWKPLQPARFATALAHLKAALDSAPADLGAVLRALRQPPSAAGPYLRWVQSQQGPSTRAIAVDDICYVQADSRYTMVVTANGEALVRKPFKELLAQLDPAVFQQIDRAMLVHRDAVAEVQRSITGDFTLRLKRRRETLAVGALYAAAFRTP